MPDIRFMGTEQTLDRIEEDLKRLENATKRAERLAILH